MLRKLPIDNGNFVVVVQACVDNKVMLFSPSWVKERNCNCQSDKTHTKTSKTSDWQGQCGSELAQWSNDGHTTKCTGTREDGLLVASAVAPTTNGDVVAAMSGIVASTAERMQKELGLGGVRDITIRCTEGKAVFKKIQSGGSESFIIAALMARRVRYHLRPLGKTATKISRLLGYRR